MRVKLYIQKNKYSSIIKKLAELIINLASFLFKPLLQHIPHKNLYQGIQVNCTVHLLTESPSYRQNSLDLLSSPLLSFLYNNLPF